MRFWQNPGHWLKNFPRRLMRGFRAQPGSFIEKRAIIVYAALLICFVLLTTRALLIHLYPSSSHSLSRIANQQYHLQLKLSRYRGTIFDHRREPLALSARLPSLFVNPKIFHPTSSETSQLARILGIDRSAISELRQRSGYFAWLKRKTNQDSAAKALALNLKGIYQVLEPSRYYPAGSSAANLLGYVGLDDNGLSGIEQQYDKTLAGDPITLLLSKDALGRTIFSQSESARPETAGDDLYLTIDRAIQEIAEQELAAGIKTAKGRGGFAIVADPHTGRVLAIANHPIFDPNNTKNLNLEVTRNQAFMNVFEPGSVLKPLVVSLAMDRKLIRETQTFDCEKGVMKIGNRTIHDAHPPKTPLLTTEEIIMHSSNVCTYKIAKILGQEHLQVGLNRFGVGMRSIGTGFPGEGFGSLSPASTWQPIRFANIAFGQGVTTSGLELVQAYSVFANGGHLVRPYILDRIESSDGQTRFVHATQVLHRVIKPETARKMRRILFRTVEEAVIGAKLAQHTAGGKTGTSQKVDPKTRAYSHSKHLSSFIGMTPAQDPHIIIYVQIDEPNQAQSYGALWAAPVFKSIAEKTLAYLNVAPDRPLLDNPADLARGQSVPSQPTQF